MPWRPITEADLLSAISGDELEGYREAALAIGQGDPVAATISQVTSLVRGYIDACHRNTLAAGATIPERLLPAALDIIVSRIPQRVDTDPGEGRRDKEKAAIRLLEQVAACKFRVEEAENPVQESSPEHGVTIARPGGRTASRDHLDGL